ncbi:hypothetical protein EJ02DRAFT_385177, partial [Clathrospora elynae]
MPQPSTIAARCAALGTSVTQVIPYISSFARRVRNSRHDLNAINHDLLVIKTGLGIAQDDFSTLGSKLPTPLIAAVSQVLDSCDDTSVRLHKAFLQLSCSSSPEEDWQAFKAGSLISLRHDLDASKVVLELAIDYIALFSQQDSLDYMLKFHVSDFLTASNELLKRTDTEEIYVNQTARDRLPSLLQAVRLLRSYITTISRCEAATVLKPSRRSTLPRPDSLEPNLGETRRSGRKSPLQQVSSYTTGSKGIGTWLANVPSYENTPALSDSAMERVTANKRSVSRTNMIPSRLTFYTDDGVSSTSRTLVPLDSRLRKSRSWCSDLSSKLKTPRESAPIRSPKYVPTMSSSDVSVFHKKITSDRIAITKNKRKEMDADEREAVDRILANIPAEATAAEVERVIWEGANPMAAHPEFGYFFIRVAFEMAPSILELLADFGADITSTVSAPTSYYSAMHAAALGGQLETVRYLASLGHKIDAQDYHGETPLHLAVKTPGAYEVARYLVGTGADVNHEAKDGQAPLQAALKTYSLEGKERSLLIELLLAHGAEGKVTRDMEGGRGDSKGRSVLGLT